MRQLVDRSQFGDILLMGESELRRLTRGDVARVITREEFRHIFETLDALWLHSGNPDDPHAELTSGKCSNGFVDVLRVLRYSNLCEIMAEQLVYILRQHYKGEVDWVIGSDHAGATLSFAVASILGAQHDFTEKGEGKTQIWRRFEVQPEDTVLQVEELITTTGTLQAVRDGVRKGNIHPVMFAPLSLALVHRSDFYTFDNEPIFFGAHFDIKTWEPVECPLCAQGSERVRPKQNWLKLKGKK
jgi:orotate phosphoribosyltransferase